MKNLDPPEIEVLLDSLALPPDVAIDNYLGTGRRAHVFSATFDGKRAIAKVYRDHAAEKYRRRYGVDIAEFEFQRNRALYAIESIRRHVAVPYRVCPAGGEYTHCMLQEFIDGRTLKDLVIDLGYLPDAVLEAGYRVIRAADAHGIHDLDISSKNVRIVDQDGELLLKLYDFNLMPQHLAPPNPFVGLALKLGLRNKSHRDYRNLKKWELRGRNAQRVTES